MYIVRTWLFQKHGTYESSYIKEKDVIEGGNSVEAEMAVGSIG